MYSATPRSENPIVHTDANIIHARMRSLGRDAGVFLLWRCGTMKSTCSSIRSSPASNASFRSSTAQQRILNFSRVVGRGKSWTQCNGYRKDKSGEKLAESEEYLLEHCTDGIDVFDILYIGVEKIPYHDGFALSVSGIIFVEKFYL